MSRFQTVRRLRAHPGRVAAGVLSAAIVLAIAVGTLWLIWEVGYSLAETYGFGVLPMTIIVGLVLWGISVSLFLLIRWIGRWQLSKLMAALAIWLVVVIMAAVAGPLIGGITNQAERRAAASACEGGIVEPLVELARAAGRLAMGPDDPWDGVVITNGSLTYGNQHGDCVATVNAEPDHVIEAASTLGWSVAGPDRLSTSGGLTVTIHVIEDEDDDSAPILELRGRS